MAQHVELAAAQQRLGRLSDISVTEHWSADERAALADECDNVADASDEIETAMDERADRRDSDAVWRQIETTSRNERAITEKLDLEPGAYLRYKSARDQEASEADRAAAAADRERSSANREIAADARHRAAVDRGEAAVDRVIADSEINELDDPGAPEV